MKREERQRLNIDVQNTPLNRKKLTGKDLLELAKYCLSYPPVTNDLLMTEEPILTIKQFCEHLAKEMSYHRELDELEE